MKDHTVSRISQAGLRESKFRVLGEQLRASLFRSACCPSKQSPYAHCRGTTQLDSGLGIYCTVPAALACPWEEPVNMDRGILCFTDVFG